MKNPPSVAVSVPPDDRVKLGTEKRTGIINIFQPVKRRAELPHKPRLRLYLLLLLDLLVVWQQLRIHEEVRADEVVSAPGVKIAVVGSELIAQTYF